MSIELINRISLKKDGVYVSTHSRNGDIPYHSVKIDSLTEAFIKGGIKELDKAVVNMYFEFCDFRGTNESILPYRKAINKAMDNNEFIKMIDKVRNLNDKAFHIANRFGEYKDLTKEQSRLLYEEFKPKVKAAENERDEFVAKFVQEERNEIFANKQNKKEPKELNGGIYQIIPIHKINEGNGKVYQEYMNFDSNNGTIIYDVTSKNLMSSPKVIKIRQYVDMINKSGIDNIGGANKFLEFIMKYPDIYQIGLDNELMEETTKELEEEEILV